MSRNFKLYLAARSQHLSAVDGASMFVPILLPSGEVKKVKVSRLLASGTVTTNEIAAGVEIDTTTIPDEEKGDVIVITGTAEINTFTMEEGERLRFRFLVGGSQILSTGNVEGLSSGTLNVTAGMEFTLFREVGGVPKMEGIYDPQPPLTLVAPTPVTPSQHDTLCVFRPQTMTVANSSDPTLDAVYRYYSAALPGGKPAYTHPDSTANDPSVDGIFYGSGPSANWRIRQAGVTIRLSHDEVDSPDLVTTWKDSSFTVTDASITVTPEPQGVSLLKKGTVAHTRVAQATTIEPTDELFVRKPYAMVIADAGTAAVNVVATYDGVLNGKDSFTFPGATDPESDGVYWHTGDSKWRIMLGTAIQYDSADDVATPDLVTTWDENVGTTVPTVTLQPEQTCRVARSVLDGCTRYAAILMQTGTDAPVATVLKNTMGGEVVWTYDSTGIYSGTLTGAFGSDDTKVMFSNPYTRYDDAYKGEVKFFRLDANTMQIGVKDEAGSPANGWYGQNLYLEISVYP